MKLMQHFVPRGDRRARVALGFATALLASVTLSAAVNGAGLNDTGFTTCTDAAGATVSCTAASAVPGQDARYGRDAAAGTSALTKVGGGANGFDFTKIRNNGVVSPPLPATAPLGTAPGDWGCTYDNTTGLMWEVKTTSGLRNSGNSYTWYSANSATNGGGVGTANGGSCFANGRCDTEKFTQDVNATNMCGHNDWRMPTVRELSGLLRLGAMEPKIDTGYFPNTSSGDSYVYWSGSPNQAFPNIVWWVEFLYGQSLAGPGFNSSQSSTPAKVRLVRSGQ